MAQGQGVLVIGEAVGGQLRPVSLEILTAGKQIGQKLGQDVVALVMGSDVADAARQLGAAGADRVLVADQAEFADYTTETVTAVVTEAIRHISPAVVLAAGTTAGRDFMPRVAARLGTGLAADCVGLDVEDGDLVAVRPVLGGRVQTAIRLSGSNPQMATVRPGSFPRAEARGAAPEAELLPVELGPETKRVRVERVVQEEAGGARLDDAKTVVSGGRGLKEPANFHLVEELAAALGGAVGASRAVVDAGWRPHQEQVGQTGRTVTPRLYVAVGISGAVQHLVGMQGSEYIVAINRDPDAPIFKIASFGIVGDLFEVVPAVIEELQAARA